MIAIVIVISIIITLHFYDFPDPKSWFDNWKSRCRSRSRPGGQDQARGHLEEKLPEKQGLFSRVAGCMNFTKHLGFVSDLDSPANQAALAEVREREEREGVTEEVPQAPLSERVKQGVTNVANTASVVATSAAGGVAPRGLETPEQAESVTGTQPGNSQDISSTTGDKGQKVELPTSDVSGTTRDKGQELPNAPTPKHSEQKQKRSLLHKGNHHAEAAEKDGHSFNDWAVRAARKLGRAVASKDLTDDTSSDKPGKR